MSGDENPASKPTPVQDVQGDGRWMSLVSDPARDTPESGAGGGEGGERRAAGSRSSPWEIGKLGAVGVVLPKEAGWGGRRSVHAIDSPPLRPQSTIGS